MENLNVIIFGWTKKNISSHDIILFLSLSPHPSKRSISFVARENILGQASVNDPPLVSSRFVLDRGAKKKKEVREIPVVSHSQRRKTKTSCCCSKKKKKESNIVVLFIV